MKNEEAIKHIKAMCQMLLGADNKPISDTYYALEMAIAALSAEPMRWIPVTERLPERNALFCDRYGDIYRGHYNKGDRTFFEDGFMDKVKNVVAWMPLPEPYTGADMREGSNV